MTFKRLLLAATLFCIGVTQGVQTCQSKMHAPILEKIAPKHASLIKTIAQKLHISDYHLDNWVLSDEEMNEFPGQERLYVIGSALLVAQELHAFEFRKNFVKKAIGLGSLLALTSVALYGITQCPIPATTPLEKTAYIAGELTWPLIGASLCYGLSDIAFGTQDSQIRHLLFATDMQVVQHLECRDGAIAALTKMRAAASSMQLDAQLLEDRIEKLKALAAT